MTDVWMRTIGELAQLIERREVSPIEVTRETLERIDAHPGLNAFITVDAERALAEARVAEEEVMRGEYRGPLHGVPIGIKDNIAVAGWPTTCGSALMAENITDYDAGVVERFRAAGAVIVGKTNMHEWAMGGTCVGGPFGTVHNPWDARCTSGGSSGGSAVAVSASLIYGSVGTDGHGSIRMPASYCGVVGLKPTYGLVSRFGEWPPTSATTDHLGPIAKDVRDAALLLNAMAGHDPKDPTSLAHEARDYTAQLNAGVKGIRVGVPRDFFFEHAAPEVEALVLKAIDALGMLGAEIREVATPPVQYMPFLTTSTMSESTGWLLPFALRGPQAFTDEALWDRVMSAQFVRTADALRSARLRNRMRRAFQLLMEEVDVLAVPATVTPTFPVDVLGEPIRPGSPLSYRATMTMLTLPFNYTGMPAISVPCGLTAEGLPVGLMLAGRHWEDDLVLRLAYAAEQATTGGYLVPPMAKAS